MSELPSRDGIGTASAAAAGRLAALQACGRLLRPSQWSKNALLFAALVFARQLFDARAVGLACLGFASFCLASSSVYVLNDLLDAERDRAHPNKRMRSIAAGEVSPALAGALALLLTAGSLALAWRVGPAFSLTAIVYLALGHAYSLGLKNAVLLDVMLIAAGFVIRAVAGAVAIAVPSSNWFILCTLFLALFLALSKRKAELLALSDAAARHRPVLARYSLPTLEAFTATSMTAVLISYALYVLDVRQHAGGGLPPLALTLPFVLFGVFRYHLLVDRGGFGERPEEVFLRDRPFAACALGFAAVALTALYLGR